MSPVSNVKTITQEHTEIADVSWGQTGEKFAFYIVNQCSRDHPPVAFLHSSHPQCSSEGLLFPRTGNHDVPPLGSISLGLSLGTVMSAHLTAEERL